MKKSIYILILILSFIFVSGCSSLNLSPKDNSKQNSDNSNVTEETPNSDDTKENKSTYSIKDYFPFNENTKYTYEGKGNEYASYKTYVDYIKDTRIQLRTNNGGTELVRVLENKDGELKIIFSKEECYYREDFTSKPSNKNEILLKEPLVKGTSWTLADGRKRYISNVSADITTPSGSFKALEITTEDKDNKTLDYYGLNTGLIKSVFTANNTEVTSTLSKIDKNTPLVQSVKFYYPNSTDEKLYFEKKNLTFNTNDMTKITFEKFFKEAPSKNVGKLIGANTKIKSLYLNNNVVYVDFSKDLVSGMNVGSTFETLILQCITNTLGNYYGVDKVYITIEDKPYSSGHIVMKKGETFKVNTKNTIELKK